MSAFDGGDMARAVFSLVSAALKQLFSKKKFSILLYFSFLCPLPTKTRLWEGLFYLCLLVFLGYQLL